MRHDDVTTDQAKKLSSSVHQMLGFLYRLEERMRRAGFDPADPLYQRVVDAYNTVHRLAVELHYLSCEKGVGRPPKK